MKKTTDYSGKSGLYCSVIPVKGFSSIFELVKEELEVEGISTYKYEELHTTVMYSREVAPHPIRALKLLDKGPYVFKGWSDKLAYWPGHNNKGYLVLKVNSRDLALRHEDYKDLGCVHSFPQYEAHISIADGLSNPKCLSKLNKLFNNLKWEITFGGEHLEDIKD